MDAEPKTDYWPLLDPQLPLESILDFHFSSLYMVQTNIAIYCKFYWFPKIILSITSQLIVNNSEPPFQSIFIQVTYTCHHHTSQMLNDSIKLESWRWMSSASSVNSIKNYINFAMFFTWNREIKQHFFVDVRILFMYQL